MRPRTLDRSFIVFGLLAGLTLSAVHASAEPPIKLHPDNPHYLLFRGKPTVLVTSTEHYGAVLNQNFDYVPYLDELHGKGLNLTRTFSGAYCEAAGSFKITDNTLAPAQGRLICPWARSSTPGYAGGGNKFDLAAWDKAYFDRLKDFVAQAGKRGIVVEYVLFCPFYEETMWNLSPMNAKNNVNGIGRAERNDVYALKHADLTTLQERMVRKVVEELRDVDNVYFEICNEPYFGGVTLAWQRRIAATINRAEAQLSGKHLIAQNIANGSQKINDPDPAVSIFNFHYATPPVTVGLNYGLNRALADDETGFRGSSDEVYRTEAWEFLIAGGAIYDNLDYSFTPKQENGSAKPNAPGGGGATLRSQLKVLKDFIEGFEFVKMSPNDSVIKGGVPDKAAARALVENGKAYAVYVRGGSQADLVLDLPAGAYKSEWLNTKTGRVEKAEAFDHAGGNRTFVSPAYREDIALAIRRR